MLGLLHAIAARDGLRLSVGHVDHGLRPESADEARLVVALAGDLDLPVLVSQLRLEPGPGLPARARDARRAALRAQATEQGAAVIALGHTATDQAETVLLHLVRGAGLPGLAAMSSLDPWSDGDGAWLRPLLDLERGRTRALAEHLRLPFCDDPTNDDHRHPRVRMRHEVLAALRELNPRVEQAMARTSVHAREAEEALGSWVDAELDCRRLPPAHESGAADDAGLGADPSTSPPAAPVTSRARWSTEGMEQLPVAVRKRIIRRICRDAGSPDDALSARTLDSVDDALGRPGPARAWDLHPRLRLHITTQHLWIEHLSPSPSEDPALCADNH